MENREHSVEDSTLIFLHCREIDFVNETVQTLAGNGTKGSDYQGGEKGSSQARLENMNYVIRTLVA